MVKFATTLHQRSGVAAVPASMQQNTHHNSPKQQNKKLSSTATTTTGAVQPTTLTTVQPTTVHIQVQQVKNGQISLQPTGTSMDFGTAAGGGELQQAVTPIMNGSGPQLVQLQSPSHHATRVLATQNIKIQQSPTNIQVERWHLITYVCLF